MSKTTLDFYRAILLPEHLNANNIKGNLPLQYKEQTLKMLLYHMGGFNSTVNSRMRLMECNFTGDDKQSQVFEYVCEVVVEEGAFILERRIPGTLF